jgi:hypothetical protein
MKALFFFVALIAMMLVSCDYTPSRPPYNESEKIGTGNGCIIYRCRSCKGAGEIKCTSCQEGRQRCGYCNGLGKIQDEYGNILNCPECLGKGSFQCTNCGGEVIRTCRECGGSGKVAIPVGNGTK